jgi:hypothetical protein
MPRGISEIPELRLEVLQKFVTTFMSPPNLVLQNIFPSSPSPSSTVIWESQVGGRGMTPFVPPGAPAPKHSPLGVAQHSAEAAYWKEKMYFDEEFLNNLRKEGTEAQYLASQARLARELAQLVNRANRRREWMFAKMLFAGAFSYSQKEGYKASVDYDIPDANQVTLGADYKWEDGTKRNIIKDIQTAKRAISETCGAVINYGICNSKVFQFMTDDPDVLTLLSKSNYGNGNLFQGARHPIVGANPAIIADLIGLPTLLIYDEQYEVKANLTSNVTGASTVAIVVDDITDFEVGATLRFYDVSAGTYEDETISAVTPETSTITVATAPSVSFKAGEDYVLMKKYFLPDDKFCLFASGVDGQPICEYKTAPYGLGRHYGLYTDRKEDWDPEGVWIRVQDKGIPVLYHRDAVYILTVN